jgi:hypothetical protein
MDFLDEGTTEEQQRALAAALRRQQALGFLGQLTGDKVLGGLGRNLVESGGEGMRQLESGRQRGLQLRLAAKKEAEDAAFRERDFRERRADRAEQRRLTLSLAGERRAEREAAQAERKADREAAAAEKAEQRHGEKLEKDVQSAGKELQDTADLANDVNFLLKVANQEGPLPGLGVWDSSKPEWLQGAEDLSVQQPIKRIAGTLIKATTGATATPAEMKRILGSYGLGAGATEQAARAGIQKLAEDTRRALETRQARFRPEVIQALKERGGVTADAIGAGPEVRAPQVDAQAQAALAWLNDPANAASPKRAAVIAKLKEMGVAVP